MRTIRLIGVLLVVGSLSLSAQAPDVTDAQRVAAMEKQLGALVARVAELEKLVRDVAGRVPVPTDAQRAKRIREGLKAECAANGLTFKGIQIDQSTGKITKVCE